MDRTSFFTQHNWPTSNSQVPIPNLTHDVAGSQPSLPAATLETYPYKEIVVDLDGEHRTFWCWFNPSGRACFSKPLLDDLRIMQTFIKNRWPAHAPVGTGFDYMVVASKSPGAFNLGGDLSLFNRLVREKNREDLEQYAKLCVDVVRDNAESYGQSIVTIAAVDGSCLGGGFEAALSCDVILAERHVKFGFPEILFGLFPGMGAVNFLSRRITKTQIDELLLSGRTFSATEMQEMGLVDDVVATGGVIEATRRYIARHQKRVNPQAAVCEALRCARQFSANEFDRITELWVETAMRLSDRDLKKMLKLVDAQMRKVHPLAAAP